MTDKNTRLVYSTARVITRTEKPAGSGNDQQADPARQRVIVRLDRKQRGGKSVTVVEGLQLSANERDTLLKRLKSGLGTGGTVKDSSLEIQGDHCKAILEALTAMGFRPKRSGG